jgi:hypothetical protein
VNIGVTTVGGFVGRGISVAITTTGVLVGDKGATVASCGEFVVGGKDVAVGALQPANSSVIVNEMIHILIFMKSPNISQ